MWQITSLGFPSSHVHCMQLQAPALVRLKECSPAVWAHVHLLMEKGLSLQGKTFGYHSGKSEMRGEIHDLPHLVVGEQLDHPTNLLLATFLICFVAGS